MYTEAEARQLVYEAGLKLVEKKLVSRTWGNISARIGIDEFVITPSGRDYESLRPEDMVVVHISDLTHQGDIKPSGEKGTHAAAYDVRPDVNFIIHTHQFYASIIAAECRSTWVAPCAAYGLPGTSRLIKNMRDAFNRYPNDKAFLMARHGAIMLGETMEEAFELADKLEEDSRKLFEIRVPEVGLTRMREAEVDHSKLKKRHHFVLLVRDPYVLECCYQGMTLKSYIDDFAQIAGADIICVQEKPLLIRKALHNRNAVLLEGVGALCTGKTEEDAIAVAEIVRKNAAAHCYVRRAMPLSDTDAVIQRRVYVSKYSKQKSGTLHKKKSRNRTVVNLGRSIMLRDTSGISGSFIGRRKLDRPVLHPRKKSKNKENSSEE